MSADRDHTQEQPRHDASTGAARADRTSWGNAAVVGAAGVALVVGAAFGAGAVELITHNDDAAQIQQPTQAVPSNANGGAVADGASNTGPGQGGVGQPQGTDGGTNQTGGQGQVPVDPAAAGGQNQDGTSNGANQGWPDQTGQTGTNGTNNQDGQSVPGFPGGAMPGGAMPGNNGGQTSPQSSSGGS